MPLAEKNKFGPHSRLKWHAFLLITCVLNSGCGKLWSSVRYDPNALTSNVVLSSFSFIDGGGTDGINKSTVADADASSIAEWNGALYAAWMEGSTYQLRVAAMTAPSTWTFVDGNLSTGLNYDTAIAAVNPKIISSSGNLFVAWHEANASNNIHVKMYGGGNTWNSIDGNTANGINHIGADGAYDPALAGVGGKLYCSWTEGNGSAYVIRVAEYNSGSSWSFVDGNGSQGINFSNVLSSDNAHLFSSSTHLYDTWYESNGTAGNIRAAVYNGNSTWSFIDGNGTNGLNYNSSLTANSPVGAVYNGQIYLAWAETNGSAYQVRVKSYDDSTWSFVDGDLSTGINYDVSKNAYPISLVALGSYLYISWNENNGTAVQARFAYYKGNSHWAFLDGGGPNGLNYNPADNVGGISPFLLSNGSSLFLTWSEFISGIGQIRVMEVR